LIAVWAVGKERSRRAVFPASNAHTERPLTAAARELGIAIF
jgi:hypothetical protein